jgi:phospholipase/lecithinase/hemolysin
MKSSLLMVLTVLATALTLMPAYGRGSERELVVFGDSLSDTGNKLAVRGILNAPPYDGLNRFGVPSDAYDEPGENFTNGLTWIEIVAEALDSGRAALPVLGPHRHQDIAGNYAWGGAHAADPVVPDGNRHLTEQVQSYLADTNYAVDPDTLHVVMIGGNDVIEALLILAADPPTAYPAAVARLEAALAAITSNLRALRSAGASKFLLINVPDVSLVPAIGDGGRLITRCFAAALNAPDMPAAPCPVIDLSSSLPEIAGNLAAEGAEVTLVDAYALMSALASDPGAFGFGADPDTPCVRPPIRCPNANDHLFWDGLHPTEAVHRLLASIVTSRLPR